MKQVRASLALVLALMLLLSAVVAATPLKGTESTPPTISDIRFDHGGTEVLPGQTLSVSATASPTVPVPPPLSRTAVASAVRWFTFLYRYLN